MRTRCFITLLASATMLAPLGVARNKKPKADPQDSIEVVGHIPLTDGTVKRFISTQHYSSYYLYVERDHGKITLIDVTRTASPAVLADVAYPSDGGSGSLSAVAGTAALVSSEPVVTSSAAQAPQTIRIMDFSDPQKPKVAREFTGVTAIAKDAGRGLIFVANADGVWILQQHFALDPEVERAYQDYVIYGSSMYPPRH